MSSKDVKSANSKSDITLKVTTAVFDGYLSVMHEQSTSSSLKASGYVYLLLVGIISIVLTLVIATTCYLVYKYCCKKKVCRKRRTIAKKTDKSYTFWRIRKWDTFRSIRKSRAECNSSSTYLWLFKKWQPLQENNVVKTFGFYFWTIFLDSKLISIRTINI